MPLNFVDSLEIAMTSSEISPAAPVQAARSLFAIVPVVERHRRCLRRQHLFDKKMHVHNYFVEDLGFAHHSPPSLGCLTTLCL